MDNITKCEICLQNYNESSHSPLVLGCGHTYCSRCINTLKSTNCPKCRVGFQRNTTFPVNYLILSLLEECKSITNVNKEIENSIKKLKEKLESRLTFLEKEMYDIQDNLKVTEEDVNILNSIEDNSKKEEFEKSKLKRELNELEKKYQKLSISSLTYFDNSDLLASFSLKKMKSKDDFLEQIYKTLKTEKVFSFKYVQKKLKFGELTIRDNRIIIHSLTLNDLPKDCKTVPFDHLKEAIRSKLFYLFIIADTPKETSKLLIIHMQDTKLVPNLIKFFTGESGPSYKNSIFKRVEDNVTVPNGATDFYEDLDSESKSNDPFITTAFNHHNNNARYGFCPDYNSRQNLQNPGVKLPKRKNLTKKTTVALTGIGIEIAEDLLTDYYKNIPSEVHCKEHDFILTPNSKNGFNLLNVKKTQKYEILGRVICPSYVWEITLRGLWAGERPKILDCGIVYEL